MLSFSLLLGKRGYNFPCMPQTLEELTNQIIACRLCPRLVEHREKVAREKRAAYRHFQYWGKPLPGFGDSKARLLVLGLAPAAHGGNRTGRVFTGDSSGTFLLQGLHKFGFANKNDSLHVADGLELYDAFMTAVVRCAPPDNKPTQEEIRNCHQYLTSEISCLPNVCAVLALGNIAMDGYLQALSATGHRLQHLLFKHGAEYQLPNNLPRLFVSYHPSRQNTQTGRLTRAMFDSVLKKIQLLLTKADSNK